MKDIIWASQEERGWAALENKLENTRYDTQTNTDKNIYVYVVCYIYVYIYRIYMYMLVIFYYDRETHEKRTKRY